MNLSVIEFGGLAVLYGSFTSFLVLAGFRLCGRQKYFALWPILLTTSTFVFLTQHPFPPIGSLSCPVGTAQPQLAPFKFLDSFWKLHARDAVVWTYLTNRVIAASAMNFLLCVGIGFAVGLRFPSLRVGVLYGTCLTLVVELTQLTGSWGLYACAYRQFNVDDLILNAAGVIFGVSVVIFWRTGRLHSPSAKNW